ncbi:hypothetical protein QEZ48_16265 [Aquamicrobium lusatiense]|uniref:hypothetical protein n=1 Tax=Aquamicrobium lusatiense TaxID=89772 RepID=UPI002455F151|nr:hypothetical protein [Aquamicrobium lusatiense]MDH4992371.1 hypothetical protein [Aquamicrobium lusatiense]
MLSLRLLLIIFAPLGADVALADTPVASAKRLAVGNTGISCVTLPCPWRGIVDLDDASRDPLRPLWNHQELPALEASTADRARLSEAWGEARCVAVEGVLDGQSLRVDKILGDCP